MGYPRREYWSALPGDLPNTGTEPTSPGLAGRLFTTEPPGKPCEDPVITLADQSLSRVQLLLR